MQNFLFAEKNTKKKIFRFPTNAVLDVKNPNKPYLCYVEHG